MPTAAQAQDAAKPPVLPPHAVVFERIRNGLNVRVGDLAPVIGITEQGLWRAIRENRVESIRIGRCVLVPARAAAPLVGIQPEPVAA